MIGNANANSWNLTTFDKKDIQEWNHLNVFEV